MYDARTNLSLQVVENVKEIWTRIFIKPLFLEMYDLQKHQVTECQLICTIPDLPVLKHIDTLQKK